MFSLALAKEWLGIGIDLEAVGKVRLALKEKVCTPREIEAILEPAPDPRKTLAMIFSFKEALFKCHFPLGQKMFYFHDAEITDIDYTCRKIEGRVLVPTSPWTPMGHITTGNFLWLGDEFVLSTAYLHRTSSDSSPKTE